MFFQQEAAVDQSGCVVERESVPTNPVQGIRESLTPFNLAGPGSFLLATARTGVAAPGARVPVLALPVLVCELALAALSVEALLGRLSANSSISIDTSCGRLGGGFAPLFTGCI